MVRMRLAKLLRRHVGEVVAVFVLLLVQALCELSLPRYMSDIVNVGVVGSEAGNSAYLGHMALVMQCSRGSSRPAWRRPLRATCAATSSQR